MIALTMVLTSTTKPMDMTYAFEWYLSPLKLIKPLKFLAHEIAMTLSIALRFIPTLLDETERIMKAQASRGVDFNHGGLFKRFGAVIALIIPLFVSALERSEELANAMIVRGYDPRAKRTRYRLLRFSWRDIIAFLFIGALFAGIIVLFVIDTKENKLDLVNIIAKYIFNNTNVKGF
jgi:energy-coupling factor transport system permease protein